jgi:hypothetical protein
VATTWQPQSTAANMTGMAWRVSCGPMFRCSLCEQFADGVTDIIYSSHHFFLAFRQSSSLKRSALDDEHVTAHTKDNPWHEMQPTVGTT